MNFTGINLDLQGVARRTYENLLYQSTFFKFLNKNFMQVARSTGTPIIEVIKEKPALVNTRNQVELESALNPALATYDSIKVDLTELRMDYSFRISPLMIGSSVENAIQGQIDLKDAEVARQIDTYGFNKLNTVITGNADGSQASTAGQVYVWNPADQGAYISNINTLKATLYNRNVSYGYILGLEAIEYGNLVSALTSILKYETKVGVEGVDMGVVASAYGVEIFPINTSVLGEGVKGYFASEVATVGDTFFSTMQQYPGTYQGFPGYFVVEGNILFGASVVRPEAMIKLTATA